MFKLLIFLSIAVYCRAAAYSGLSSSNLFNEGLEDRIAKLNELLKISNNLGVKSDSIPPAIKTERKVEVKALSSTHDRPKEEFIDVSNDGNPFTIHFRTSSNRVVVHQSRSPGVVPEVEHSLSEDEPQRVIYEVVKPVIQEVHEIIQPYRRLVQEIRPVIEELHTIVSKGEPRANRVFSSLETSSNPMPNSLSNYSPQGKVSSSNGVPVYRSLYRGPAYMRENYR